MMPMCVGEVEVMFQKLARETLSNGSSSARVHTDQQDFDERLAVMMRAAQNGDARVYSQLLQEITPLLRNIVRKRRKLLRPEDIEDLVQDILLSLHAVRATYDSNRPFMPWLLAITRNRLADGARHYARRTVHEVQVENLAITFSDKEANTDDGEFGDPEALKKAIEALPPRQRQAVEMLKLKEMSLKEASGKSGTSVSALKVSVHRAMIALRKTLVKR